MTGDERAGRAKRFVLWHSLFVLLGAATLGKLLFEASSGIGPWPVLLIAGVYLLVRDVRITGWYSIAGVTAVFTMIAFWLKWILGTQPSVLSQRLQYDNDAAVIVSSLFVFSMGIGYSVLRGKSATVLASESAGSSDSSRVDDGLSSSVTSMLFLLGVALVFARLGLAAAYNIGVPGVVPMDPGLIRPITSLVYYVSLTAPLAITAVLAVHGPPRWGWMTALALGSAYAIAGATIGYRSYPVLAFVTLVFSWLLVRSRPGRPKNAPLGSAFVLVVAAVGALVSLRIALMNRARDRVGATNQGVADFLFARIGGLDYLSPVVHAVDRHGANLALASPGTWDVFMRVAVYGLPPGAVTGFAATLPGWLYGIGSFFTVVTGGLIAGWGARRVDRLCLRARIGPKPSLGTALTVGAALCWLNFLAEGTLRASALQAGGYGVAALTVALFSGEIRSALSRPHAGRVLAHACGATPAGGGRAQTGGT